MSPKLPLHMTPPGTGGLSPECDPRPGALGSRRQPWRCRQPDNQRSVEEGSAVRGQHGSGPPATVSHGDGARSLTAHSPRQQKGRGVWEVPEGQGPRLPPRTQGSPRRREELERWAPSRVGRCPDSVCCRRSDPPYLEPCSEEKPAETTGQPGQGPGHSHHDRAQHSACTGCRNRRGEVT